LLGYQCLRIIDTSYRCHRLFSEFVHHQNCPLLLSTCPRGHCSHLHQHTTSVTVLHIFELHDTSMGHARLVCTQFYFSTPCERFGSYRFPSPSNGSLLTLSSTLFLTMVLSVEETLMYFGYTYAPNLTHQGASVITEISSANGYRNPTSSNTLLVHPWTKKCISKRSKTIQPVIKSACAKIQRKRVHVRQSKMLEKAHMPDARLWMQKAMHTSE
jgi:hypothetical protein